MIKNILLGVTGGIAAYKAIELVSGLKKQNYDIKTILTPHALEFVKELPFRVLSKNRVYSKMFDLQISYDTDHIELSKWGDILIIYPATANIIGKIYAGIADDLLSTIIMTLFDKKKLICPAMNTKMYENPIVQRNINYLKSQNNYYFIDPVEKKLACGDIGKGALCSPESVINMLKDL